SVEPVQLAEALEHDAGPKLQAEHLLADRDGVLVEAGSLVGLGRLQVTVARLVRLALLVEEIRQEHEVVGFGVLRRDELAVLGQCRVEIAGLDRALRPAFDVDGLVHGWRSPCAGASPFRRPRKRSSPRARSPGTRGTSGR